MNILLPHQSLPLPHKNDRNDNLINYSAFPIFIINVRASEDFVDQKYGR